MARASVGFSWILKNTYPFLRWNEPHHFRASTSIKDDGAISEGKQKCCQVRWIWDSHVLGTQPTLDLKLSPWRKCGELTKLFVDHSWFILILEPSWFAAPLFSFEPSKTISPKTQRMRAARVEWLDAVVPLGWRWCRDGGGPRSQGW